jgi:hypothetical protein
LDIFAVAPELDAQLSGTLANRDWYAEKRLAKQQSVVSLLRPDERVHGVGADITGTFGISVVTDERHAMTMIVCHER